MINFKSLLNGCEQFIQQSDLEHVDFFNKTKLDKILDEVRDNLITRYPSGEQIKSLFMKMTESDSDQFEKAVMTLDHFSKFIRNIVGDRHSTKEVE